MPLAGDVACLTQSGAIATTLIDWAASRGAPQFRRMIAGTVLLFVSGSMMFWIFGLALCLFVGPAQSSSRTFLARLAPPGREGQLFGLYATTGRAVSFLAPALFGLFTFLFHADRAGIVGILLVLLAGLVALWPVRPPVDSVSRQVAGR